MCVIKIDCKITQFFSRARAYFRDKCVKFDTLIGCVALKW